MERMCDQVVLHEILKQLIIILFWGIEKIQNE